MTAKWYQGSAPQRAAAELAERFPGQTVVIHQPFDIAWAGWEGDCQGALISVDGTPTLMAIDQTIAIERFEIELRNQLAEYRRLIKCTEAVLDRYESIKKATSS